MSRHRNGFKFNWWHISRNENFSHLNCNFSWFGIHDRCNTRYRNQHIVTNLTLGIFVFFSIPFLHVEWHIVIHSDCIKIELHKRMLNLNLFFECEKMQDDVLLRIALYLGLCVMKIEGVNIYVSSHIFSTASNSSVSVFTWRGKFIFENLIATVTFTFVFIRVPLHY